MIEALAHMYEREPFVCSEGYDISNFFRASRGRHNNRRHQPDGFETQRQIAIKAGVPVSVPARAENEPDAVGLGVLKQLAAVHGYEVAVVFYRKD